MPYELDIVIPVYNEGENILPTLRALAREVQTRARILICYDRDDDNTLPAVKNNPHEYQGLAVEFVKNPSRGPHAAVMAGLKASTAPYVVVLPADDDYNAGILDQMVAQARSGAEVVCASRFMKGGSMVGCPPLKAFLVRVGSFVLHYIARVPAHDVSNGFRLFSRRVIEEIPVESTAGFTYSIELLVKAHRLGWRIAEVPAQWQERKAGASRFKVLSWLPAYLRWCWYAFATTYWYRHGALVVLLLATLLLSLVPLLHAALYIGGEWRGVPQVYMDEYIYYSHVTEAGTGNVLFGNPYIREHRYDPPLVLFGSNVLAALPFLFGLPLLPALVVNFVLWSLVFVALYYALLREFALPRWLGAATALFAYVQSYDQVYRVSVRQEVFPFLLFFYIALIRFLKDYESRSALVLLAVATGVSFYIYGFLWQSVVVTLGLLAFGAVVMRNWTLLRRALLASLIGGIIGAPAFLYTLWVTYQPHFWESVNRFGLVETHLPVAEVVYSGGWVGVVLACIALLYWRAPALRSLRTVQVVLGFVVITGVALWAMQGSNVLTGKLLEIGDHMRRFIILWLPLATVLLGYLAYVYRIYLSRTLRVVGAAAVVLLMGANAYFAYHHSILLNPRIDEREWKEQQTYAAPLRWLEEHEQEPVVVWGNPESLATVHIPVLTKHYVLFVEPTLFMLMPTWEVRERYLVARYFDGVTVESLRENMLPHAGRASTFHLPKTIERHVKLCMLVRFFDRASCGEAPTPQELMGEQYFKDLAARFAQDIQPNIGEYLHKYQVAYVLVEKARDSHYKPERLGGVRVYSDGRFDLYKLPQ